MADDERERKAARKLGRRGGFLGRYAQAAHSGVDMERRRQGRRGHGPFRELVERTEHGPQLMGQKQGPSARRRATKDIDRRIARDFARALGFAGGGDEKGAATGGQQLAHDGLEPEPIGVGLDNRRAFRRGGAFGEQPVVCGERPEVDRQERDVAGVAGCGASGHGERLFAGGHRKEPQASRSAHHSRRCVAAQMAISTARCLVVAPRLKDAGGFCRR